MSETTKRNVTQPARSYANSVLDGEIGVQQARCDLDRGPGRAVDKDAVRAASRLEEVIPALTGNALTLRGREFVTRCPFHEDTRPSLRVNVEKQQWHCDSCHVGGDVFAFVGRLRKERFAGALTWLAHRAGLSNGHGYEAQAVPTRHPQSPEREHIYVGERGEPIRKVVIGRRRPDGTKIVWQERPDGRGGWVKGTQGQRRAVYRLRDLSGKPAVVVAEGEKDVDRLWAIGIPATCNVGGAGNWIDSDTVQLKAAGVERVRVIGDHDESGRRHNAVVARSCAAQGIDARPVLLPDVPDKGDVSNFLDAHGATGKADLEALLRAAPPWTDAESVGCDGDAEDPHLPHPEVRGGYQPMLTCLAAVEPERVTWIWPGRLASGKLNLLVGDPGLGKSFVTLDVVARYTTGTVWPDGFPAGPVGTAILLSAEDGLADTIRPRLDALGADPLRAHALPTVTDGRTVRGIQLADVTALESAIVQTGAGLIVIDPISAYVGDKDSHRDSEVRGLLAPLAQLAERHHVTILGVMHPSKNSQRAAIYRTIGSIAFVGAARVTLAVAVDPDRDERRLLAPIKNNLSAPPPVLAFSIPDGRLKWEPNAVTGVDVQDLLRGPVPDREERRESDKWLRDLLVEGPMPVKVIEREARAAGMSKSTIERAKARIHARAVKAGRSGPWSWELPSKAVTKVGRPSPEFDGLREIPKESLKAVKSDSLTAFQRPSTDPVADSFTLEPINGTPQPAVVPAKEEFDL